MKLPNDAEVVEGPYFMFTYSAGMLLTGTRPALKVRHLNKSESASC